MSQALASQRSQILQSVEVALSVLRQAPKRERKMRKQKGRRQPAAQAALTWQTAAARRACRASLVRRGEPRCPGGWPVRETALTPRPAASKTALTDSTISHGRHSNATRATQAYACVPERPRRSTRCARAERRRARTFSDPAEASALASGRPAEHCCAESSCPWKGCDLQHMEALKARNETSLSNNSPCTMGAALSPILW